MSIRTLTPILNDQGQLIDSLLDRGVFTRQGVITARLGDWLQCSVNGNTEVQIDHQIAGINSSSTTTAVCSIIEPEGHRPSTTAGAHEWQLSGSRKIFRCRGSTKLPLNWLHPMPIVDIGDGHPGRHSSLVCLTFRRRGPCPAGAGPTSPAYTKY